MPNCPPPQTFVSTHMEQHTIDMRVRVLYSFRCLLIFFSPYFHSSIQTKAGMAYSLEFSYAHEQCSNDQSPYDQSPYDQSSGGQSALYYFSNQHGHKHHTTNQSSHSASALD